MKDFMNRAIAFLTFDTHLQAQQISLQFSQTHHKRLSEIDNWSTNATRQQLISRYWYTDVLEHFAILFGLSVGITLILRENKQPDVLIASLFFVGPLAYLGLYLFQYRPKFNSTYLPLLETVKEAYEKKQLEQIEKCRHVQLSNFSLALFFYVLTKTNNLNQISCDDYSANLLRKLYGVDSGSLKKNLELILGTAKRKNMSERKITEIRNRFAETYEYLEALEFNAGIEKLKELEASFFNA
ncbi:hypothetical protein [Sediminibacterium sp.]|uniref:hypothetical protein n=1 Tax=Sediminibacterium sp. TaxID=1917865 RepID=UPI003F6EF0D3